MSEIVLGCFMSRGQVLKSRRVGLYKSSLTVCKDHTSRISGGIFLTAWFKNEALRKSDLKESD